VNKKYQVVSISSGNIFKRETGDIMMKLINPEKPLLANVNIFDVWAADIGNGQIIKLNPCEEVTIIGHAYKMIFGANSAISGK